MKLQLTKISLTRRVYPTIVVTGSAALMLTYVTCSFCPGIAFIPGVVAVLAGVISVALAPFMFASSLVRRSFVGILSSLSGLLAGGLLAWLFAGHSSSDEITTGGITLTALGMISTMASFRIIALAELRQHKIARLGCAEHRIPTAAQGLTALDNQR